MSNHHQFFCLLLFLNFYYFSGRHCLNVSRVCPGTLYEEPGLELRETHSGLLSGGTKGMSNEILLGTFQFKEQHRGGGTSGISVTADRQTIAREERH